MNLKNIDLVNIGLMLFSCVAAFVLPFELFLFSYAVLGPLHYLTEINWLHRRNYFTNGKRDYIWLVVLGVLLTFLALVYHYRDTDIAQPLFVALLETFGENVFDAITVMIFMSFVLAMAMVLFKDFLYRLLFFTVALILGAKLKDSPPFIILFGVFLPTLIHVFIFTGLFIFYGALKSKSKTGIASLVVFAACAVSFFIFQPQFSFYQMTTYARQALEESGFIQLNESFIQLFNLGEYTREAAFTSTVGVAVMRFVAFAYTYHYLNWFSKTEVIKWHQVPKQQLAAVVAAWLASVAIYAYNYSTGLMVLYFLSMLHVLLEFPLNYRSVIGIGEEMKQLISGGKPTVAAGKSKGRA